MVATEDTVREAEAVRTRVLPRPEWYARRPFLLLLLVLVGVATWLLSPQAFSPARGGGVGWGGPQAADAQVLHDAGAYPDREVRLLLVRPRVVSGPAGAVRVLVCGSGTVGAVTGPAPDGCDPVAERSVLRPADVGTGDQLVLAVDPVPGRTVVVDGVDVLYRDGFRVGYQHVGGHHTVPFAPAG